MNIWCATTAGTAIAAGGIAWGEDGNLLGASVMVRNSLQGIGGGVSERCDVLSVVSRCFHCFWNGDTDPKLPSSSSAS